MTQHAPFTRQDAEDLGWSVYVVGEEGLAWKGDAPHTDEWELGSGKSTAETIAEMTSAAPVPTFSVTSGLPLFFVLATIAQREGVGFVEGYGGDQPITPELVFVCSGERL